MLTSAACASPTDAREQLLVSVETPTALVAPGATAVVTARARRANGADTTDAQGVVFTWATSNPSVATVRDLGDGRAEVTGVGRGLVDVTATASGASAGSVRLRVGFPLEVDSVRPGVVRWGDTLTVFGFGLDALLFGARLSGTPLVPYPFSAQRDQEGRTRVTYWVPYPASTGSVQLVGSGTWAEATQSTTVQPSDLFEPNDSAPRAISLDGSRPVPSAPSILFLNLALAFEPLTGSGTTGADWYRFTHSTTRDFTVILRAGDATYTFVSDTVIRSGAGYGTGSDGWRIAPGDHACHGLKYRASQRVPDSSIVALAGMSSPLHVVAGYDRPGAYSLSVVDGYVVTDPRIPRDAHEEDDFCTAAEARGAVTLPYRDTLTIDNPGDVDWFLVTGDSQSVRMRAVVLDQPSSAVRDTARDLNVYLTQVPDPGNSVIGFAADTVSGPNADMTMFLIKGIHYYVVIVDYAGVPTRYALCIGPPATCDAFPVADAVERRPPSARP
ncbi:MAG: Ig-like domain-containing protein [Gemmatimonadales bacterium]